MKKTILFAILFTLFISCSEDDENTVYFNDHMCFDELSKGFLNYSKNTSTDSYQPDGEFGPDSVSYYNQSKKESFYVRYEDGKLVYSSLSPLVYQYPISIINSEFKLDFCSQKSFIAEHDSIFEKIIVLVNGEPVEGEILHNLIMTFNFVGTAEEVLYLNYHKDEGKLFKIHKYEVDFDYEELIIKPEELVFQNGQRTRNKMESEYILHFAPGLGIIYIEDSGNIMKLINYGPPIG